jgi:hypothetical protein
VASSPRWQYTRRSIPSLEKGIALLTILVLAGLAGLFVWDIRRPRPANPFSVDPKLLAEASDVAGPSRRPPAATSPGSGGGQTAGSVGHTPGPASRPSAARPTPAGASLSKGRTDGPLPKLQGADLTGPAEVRRFNADTLYEKIDGKAQLYLSYNFVELVFATYAAGEASLDVYVYDMGQADNAFGIYKAEEGEGAETVEVGRNGYTSGASVFFWKGKHYVNVLAGGEEGGHGAEGGSPEVRQAAVKLAVAIAERLQDAGQSLWAEQILPQADRVAGSFEFRKSDAFGLDFLNDVFSAQYKVGQKELTLFITRHESPEQAGDVLEKYEAFATRYGKVLGKRDVAGATVMTLQSSGTYDVVFAKGIYCGGVTAAEDREAAESVVTGWVRELKQ